MVIYTIVLSILVKHMLLIFVSIGTAAAYNCAYNNMFVHKLY